MTVQNLIEDYFDYQKKYQDKYGPNTIVLMQVGSFHEAYQTLDKGFELNKIGDILNFVVSKRNKSNPVVDIKNPYMLGFPTATLQKHLKILVENLLTVVIIDQVSPPPNPKREITGIYSPGTYCEEVSNPDSNNIISIYIEEITNTNSPSMFVVGSSIVDITTGKTMVHESYSLKSDENISLDDITKIIQSYSCKEYIITTNNLKTIPINKLIAYLELSDKILHSQTLDALLKKRSNIQQIKYQKELFKTVYGSKFYNSNNIIEDINLERLNYGRLSLVIILNYIYDHNKKLINNLNIPEIIEKDNYMHLGNNAIYQLNVFNNDTTNISNMFSQNTQYKSLFDVINKTSTSMGRRFLKDSLVNPLLNIQKIVQRYEVIEQFIKDEYWKEIETMLNIPDIERLVRKISIQQIHPLDLYNCINGLKSASHLLNNVDININILSYPKNKLINDVNKMLQLFDNTLNYDELSKYLLNDITGPIFKTGKYRDIDDIINEINDCKKFINMVELTFNSILNTQMPKKKTKKMLDEDDTSQNETLIYVDYNENDGYYLCLTKRRSELLQQYFEDNKTIKINNVILSKDSIEFRSLKKGNTCKIFIPDIQKKSDIIISLTDDLKKNIKDKYVNWLSEIYSQFQTTFAYLIEFVCIIDFCKSGAKCAISNKYIKPTISNNLNNKSFIDAQNLRHPICEKLLIDVEYVPINVKLGLPNHEGVLLFGLNSVGKSTLQKSIGINLILAQIGYYVAATNFEYYPYKSLMTRITANDNLFKGLSSFALEISELRSILKRSNENTMIIADEVCKGTEHQSSLIIVMTMLEILSKNKCSFITATHLHDLTKLERLKKLSNIKLYHLHVDYDERNNILKYDRKLLEGPGENFYGLNVAKCLINDNSFMTIANEIKLEVCNDFLVGSKSSKYNSNLIVSKCQICSYYPKTEYDRPLETHHINFQKNTDKDGFILNKIHIHKNHKSNLCVLCFKCHDKIDTGEIDIMGYENTSNGPILNFKVYDKKQIIQEIKNNANSLKKEIDLTILKYSNITTDINYKKKINCLSYQC